MIITKPISSASIILLYNNAIMRNHKIVITHFEPCICAALFFETKLVIFSCSRSLAWHGHQYQKVFVSLKSSLVMNA